MLFSWCGYLAIGPASEACSGSLRKGEAMKEIKAYIQRCCVNKVVDELEKEHAPGITIVEIHPVGYGYEPNYFGFQQHDAYKRYSYLRIVKVEVVCADRDVDRFAETIRRLCSTGSRGDGMIFISDVSDAIRIRNGDRGEQALTQPKETTCH